MPTSPISTARRTVSGRKVLLVAALLVVTLAGVAGWYMIFAKPKAGAYIDVVALDDQTIVAVRHEVTEGRAFVELIDVAAGEAGLRWQALVPTYKVPDGAVGVAYNDNAITVRFPRDGETQIFGFATDSARKLGTIELGDGLAKEDDGAMAANVATLSGGSMSFELLEPDGKPTRVFGVALTDGSIAWQLDLPRAGVIATWVTKQHLVIQQPGSVSVIDRDGHVVTRDADAACVIPGELDTIAIGVAGGIDVYAGADKSDHLDAPGFTGLCGRSGREPRFVTEDHGNVSIVSHAGVVTVATGTVARGDRANAALAAPFAGELDPIAVLAIANADGTHLIGWDLAAGKLAWQSRASHDLDGVSLVDGGAAVLARAGDVLASIDPATGHAHAVRAPDTLPLRAHHVAKDAVWIVGPRGLRALDVATLAPRGSWHQPPTVTPADDALTRLGL